MIRAILGTVIAFLILSFVNKVNFLGAECVYIGSFRPSTVCIHPAFYYFSLAVAAGLIIWGLADLAFSAKQVDNSIPDDTWVSLSKYDPDIKLALEDLRPLGPAAEKAFRSAYAAVQNKAAILAIVEDIKRAASSGDPIEISVMSQGGQKVEDFLGQPIYLVKGQYIAGNNWYSSLGAARKYIERNYNSADSGKRG